jgi:hypothetical protein
MRAIVPAFLKPFGLSLCGSAMVLSALPHGLAAWPKFQADLNALNAGDTLTGALHAGWLFGTMMMVVCGSIVLGQAWQLAKKNVLSHAALWPIAIGYMGYGVAAFLLRDFNTHYVGFISTGVLLGAVLLLDRSSAK